MKWQAASSLTFPDVGECRLSRARDGGTHHKGGGGCFLATAVSERRGEPDDGPMLTVLRQFRDGWMPDSAEGKVLISENHAVGPGIVQAIPGGTSGMLGSFYP